jgi:ribosomal protein S18 acetylase RimI-like enzyme
MPVNQIVQIRASRPRDASALAAVHEEAWRSAYQGIIPHLALERMIAKKGPGWWETALRQRAPLLVLDFGGETAGYVTYGRSRLGRRAFQGEIFELYLHPIYRGLGFGEHLFDAARCRLAQLRLKGLIVWALADNDSACAFYFGLGGKPVAGGNENFGDVSLRKVAFAWS